ncbi:MAG: RNA polymerase sigma factor [Pirellulaceae bacterium]
MSRHGPLARLGRRPQKKEHLHSDCRRPRAASQVTMPNMTTQPSLLSRARDPHNNAAWRELEAKYRDLVTRYCRARGLQAADIEDVQQLVWVQLSRGLQTFEYDPSRGRFRHYLGFVVRSAISRHFRRPAIADRALDTAVMAIHAQADESAPDEQWEREWVDHHFRLAMEKIKAQFEPRSMDVFDRLLAGARVEEIAEAFNLSVQAVHKVKQRIRNRLRALIERQIMEEERTELPVVVDANHS